VCVRVGGESVCKTTSSSSYADKVLVARSTYCLQALGLSMPLRAFHASHFALASNW
jgi:hypothetical protein